MGGSSMIHSGNIILKTLGRFFVILGVVLVAALGQAKTLIVTDIDDTIKVAHILEEPVCYANKAGSRFKGMSELYNGLLAEIPDSKIVYLSNAYSFLMKGNHKKFLEAGHFPTGQILLRSLNDGSNFKKEQIRELLNNEKPDTLILLGDNGEKDIDHYSVIANEYSHSNIQILQYIRIAYSPYSYDDVLNLALTQVGFVTPIEIILNLKHNGVVSDNFANQLSNAIGSQILAEKPQAKYQPQFFPDWMRCEVFEWADSVGDSGQVVTDVRNLVTKMCSSRILMNYSFITPLSSKTRFSSFK